MKKINIILVYGFIALLLGCASAKKAELTSGDHPENAVAEVTQVMKDLQAAHVDLLANKEYSKGRDSLAKAEKGLARNHKDEDILKDAAIAKAYFQDAGKKAESRSSFATRILKARESSLQAGLRNSVSLVDTMEDIDDDLRNETSLFSKALSPVEFSEFQKKYLVLEVKAVQFRELNSAGISIQKAIDNDAEDLAPKTLRTAELDLKAAENVIDQSPRSPGIYLKGVQESVSSAALLADTMNVIMNAEGTPEDIALQIVHQNRTLGKLNKNVGELQANLKTTESTLQEKEDALKSQNEQLARASTQVRFQQAMDEARKTLPQSEALVYQQGKTLVFRLKKMNFKIGTATIPESSKPLLSKINLIIMNLDAEKVIVQGHSDSIGADDLNQKLSTKRATSVATHLSYLRGGYKIEYIGYGESRPIASNESKSGRAINRRVDLVVSVNK